MKKYVKMLSCILSLTLFLSIIPSGAMAIEESQIETIEYIVRYDTEELLNRAKNSSVSRSSEMTVEEILENNLSTASDVRLIDEIGIENEHTTKLFSIDTENKEETTYELNSIDGIYYAEINYKIHTLDSNPGVEQQWAINGTSDYGINLDNAWKLSQGQNVLVAVLDTGIDITHRDLQNNIYTNPNETVNGIDSDNNGYVDDIHGWDFTTYQNATQNGDNVVYDDAKIDEHGTHVAGIIAATSNEYDGVGVAPSAKILPVKILSENDGTVFTAIKGIEYAEMMGATIANCSWGGEHYSQFLYDTILNSDMFFVCAAGNDGNDIEQYPTYPAAYDLDNIISVGATNSQGEITTFSNYGKLVDVFAPGKDIYSTLPNNAFGSMDGTSMAAPFVSGCAALLLGKSSNLTAEEIKNRIMQTTNVISDLYEKSETGGIVNAGNLLLTTVKPTDFETTKSGNRIINIDNEIYTIGGYNDTGYIDKIEKYNFINNTWTAITNMPTAVSDFAVGYLDGKIYIVGGISNNPIDAVQIYDIDTGVWSIGEKLPEALYGSAYYQKNNFLYIFGGTGITEIRDCVYRYDMSKNTWETKNGLPDKITYASAVMADNTIYIVGGNGSKSVLNTIYMYNETEDTYGCISHLNINRKNCATVAIGNKIYILGGSNSYNNYGLSSIYENNKANGAYIESLTGTVEVFDVVTKICTVIDSGDDIAMGTSVENYFDNVYVFGGWNGSYINTVSMYFGASVPKNIKVKTNNGRLNIKWNPVENAIKYNIEIDGTVYETNKNTYQIINSDDVEHKIRVQAVNTVGSISAWSDYIYHYSNSTLLDAKVISVNSNNSDKLYETGQVRWYKLNNYETGNLTLKLTNIPTTCNYIMQLCSLDGTVIATATSTNTGYVIENVVLSPYPYYLSVTSVYGGSFDISYNLISSFISTSDDDVPDRVKCAFLKPSSLDDLTVEGMRPTTEYEGEEVPNEIKEKEIANISPESTNGGCGENLYIEEDEIDKNVDEQISLMSLNSYSEETGTLTSVGNIATGSISISSYTATSTQKCKVVVEVIPENPYDQMKVEWTGNNTNYSNFWWHFNENSGKYVYYLTALLSYSTSGTYKYKITCDYLSNSSSGKYTVRKYIICDSYSNEDYHNNNCGNEIPLYAMDADPTINSYVMKTGKIDHPYDRDFYYVTASYNEKITAYLKSPEGKVYDVSIYDNRCTSNSQSASEHMDGKYIDNISYATVSGKTSSSVKYCIRVGSVAGDFSCDDTYTLYVYKYQKSKLGNFEINDTFDLANEVKSSVMSYIGTETKIATPISFSIDSPVDVDYYAVDMEVGDKISIKMDLPSNYNDTSEKYRIEICSNVVKNETTTYLQRSYNNPDSMKSKYVTLVAETAGTYYVGIRSLSAQYNYAKYGTLTITKTSSASKDSYEAKDNECSNDFARTTILVLFGYEFFVDGATPIQNSISANFDNELDVDWYKFVNGTETKTATISINGSNMSGATGVIVLDSQFRLLSAGINGNTYTFTPNETYYIATFVNDGKYSAIKNDREYTLSVNLGDLRSDLVFTPLSWGTFVYDNDPEFLTDEDMADYNLGNRLLMSADNLTGVVDFQSSHSAKAYMLDGKQICFDILLHNPTQEVVTVDVDRIGYQLPYENSLGGVTDWTTTNWVCLKAWADFLQINIRNSMLIGRNKSYYKDYDFQYVYNKLPNGGHYELQPGQTVWMLGNARPVMTQTRWSPFNLVSRIKISDGGSINMGFAAFRNVNNVYTPQSAKLIYDVDTQRSYPSGLPDSEKEHDVNGKPKGVATSVAETETHTQWTITNETSYFKPTVYNYSNETGYTIGGTENDYWVTNFNPAADTWGFNCGVESDILRMDFYDDVRQKENGDTPWIFDNRHTNPLSGNDMISGEAPVSNAMPLGNYGVVERYTIDITNATDEYKSISYIMNTGSHAIVTYKDGTENWNRKIKLSETQQPGETYEQFSASKKRTIFEIGIGAKETKQLVIEVILPNADAGGLQHQLKVN